MLELVSVIVPTFNEDRNLATAIRSIGSYDHTEVIVSDGGSSDETLDVARRCRARVVHSQRNRAEQLNAGAAAARGSTLLFLHADSVLAPGSIHAVRETLADEKTKGGAFTLKIGSSTGMRLITWGTNMRSRWLGLPYGDQAIFVRNEAFHSIGGFRRLEIMEDVDFVQRLRRIGRLALIDLPVETSARRWRTNGLLRTTLANASALTLFKLGIAPHRIRRCYDTILSQPKHDHGPA